MKKLLSVLLLTGVSASWAGVMPEGTYKGIGSYETSGGTPGSYRVETTIDADGNFNSAYHWADKTRSLTLQAKGNAQQFDVLSAGKKVGTGSCAGERCDYSATEGNVRETLVFTNDKLIRFGTKTVQGTMVTWFETQIK